MRLTREIANGIFWTYLAALIGGLGVLLYAAGVAVLVVFGFAIFFAGYLAWWIVTWNQRNALASRARLEDDTAPPVEVPPHFDTVEKRCYDYGCTTDCPVAKERES